MKTTHTVVKKSILVLAITSIFVTGFAQNTNTFTDTRDAKTYKTIKIGKQTWFAENIAFEMEAECWTYKHKRGNASKYGYLYSWQAANMVCPKGWHLPSDKEWQTLADTLGGLDYAGKSLKSEKLWSKEFKQFHSNKSGFSALPGGSYVKQNQSYEQLKEFGYWWSSTLKKEGVAWGVFLSNDNGRLTRFTLFVENGYSVRCIKDE